MNRVAFGPAASELESVAPDVMNDVIRIVKGLFRHSFCIPVKYNVKRIAITSRYSDGTAKAGNMEWSIAVQPTQANYTALAFVDIEWTDQLVRMPLLFRNHQGQVRGFSEASLKQFIFAGADLTNHIPAILPRR